MHSEIGETLEKIRGGDWSDETQEAVRKAVAEFADDYGYDLDEEGQPLSDTGVGDTSREEEGIREREAAAA
jgi:F-type H+-transporting ATPase subunit alpha